MKNRLSYIALTFFAVFAVSSCSDVLDRAPDGKISIEEVFSDNDKTMYYLNTCYSSINGKGCQYFFWNRPCELVR